MASLFWVGGTGEWNGSNLTSWATSSGGGTHPGAVPGSSDTVTFDGSSGGGTVTVNTNFNVTSVTMGAFTGTLDFSINNNSPTMQTFNCSGTGTRTLNMGNGTWTVYGNITQIINIGTITGLTLNPNSSTINCTYNGGTGTRTINVPTGITLNNLKFSAGTDTISILAICNGNVDLTGFAGTLSTNAFSVGGNLVIPSGVTVTTTSTAITFTGTSTQSVTINNAVQCNRTLIFNGVGGTWNLQDNLDMSGANSRVLRLTNGTLVSNGHNIKCGTFGLAAGTKSLTLTGTDTLELVGNGSVWDAATNGTGFTITPNSSTIKMSDSTNNASTFAGNGLTYANIWFSRGVSTATNTITGTNTFADFKDDGTIAHSIVFPNVTTTVSTFSVSGNASQLITLARTGGSGTFTLSAASGTISRDYLSISNSVAVGGAAWYAGAHSTDGGGNTGWVFTVPPVFQPVGTKTSFGFLGFQF